VLTTERRRRILSLGLPILGGMLSQNLLNLVDTAIVGVLGNQALAAVGMGNFTNFMASSFITGLASGVQAVAARRQGEDARGETAVPLNAGALLALALGLPLTLILWFLAPRIFPLLASDPEVARIGAPFLQWRLVGLVPLGINFAFRGYWNAVDMSSNYLRTLVTMHISNAALAYVLVFGKLGMPALGVTGAGIATTMATFLGTAHYVALGWKHARAAGFLRKMPDRATMSAMLRVSLPSGLQQFFFASGMTVFFWIIGKIGTAETAAANVLINVALVAILPGIGFGLAAASLVGQALGRKDHADAKEWGWDVVRLAVLVIAVISSVGVLVPDLVLSGFLHEPATREIARLPLRILALSVPIDAIGVVLMNGLIGAGDARRVMVRAIILQWIVFLPGAYIVGPVLGGGLVGVWALQAGYRLVQSLLFMQMWREGRWAEIKL
jgi:MATE family multidrug resistance protein